MALLMVEDGAGQTTPVEVASPSFVIGKRAGNSLALNRPGISREHCVILLREGAHYLRDLGSRNGTFVNDTRIATDVQLKDGDAIQLGEFTLVYHEKPGPAPSGDVAEARASTTAQPPDTRIPVALKKRLHEEIIERLDLKHTDILQKTRDDLWTSAAEVARAAIEPLRDELPSWLPEERLVKEVVDEAVALGPIEDLLADADVDEIMINGWDRVYVERHGRLVLTDKQFTSNEHVLATIRRILAPIGRRIDESSPMVDARLQDGSRVNAIINPVCLTGPALTIRKFAVEPFTVDDLVGFGSLTASVGEFFRICVETRQNICISGGTGSGKTTLLNVVSSFIPVDERIVTIEDAAELKLSQEHVVSLEAKPPNIEGKGAIPIRELVINSLRMRPDRILVGECRGGEALDMLQAMNTGHDGSLTTVHANSVRDSLARLETMVLMAGLDLPSRAIREQISSAIHIIMQTARLSDGTRKVVAVAELTGMEEDVFLMQNIFEFKQRGIGPNGRIIGDFVATGNIPSFVSGLRERGIPVDMKMFQPPSASADS